MPLIPSKSKIKVYPTKESVGWIIGAKGYRIKNIGSDTHTKIFYNQNQQDGYFTIDGNTEDVHKARIIIQDLEKSYYRKLYYTELQETEKEMGNIVNRLKEQLNNCNTTELH